jgi:hypothetical protein
MSFVLLSVFISGHPLADAYRTALKRYAILLASRQKPHWIAIRQPHVS